MILYVLKETRSRIDVDAFKSKNRVKYRPIQLKAFVNKKGKSSQKGRKAAQKLMSFRLIRQDYLQKSTQF